MSQTRPVVATKKPATVEAWKWDGTPEQGALIVEWINKNKGWAEPHPYEALIVLGDGFESVKPGAWVIRDQFNDFWPLPDDVYHAVYSSPVQ